MRLFLPNTLSLPGNKSLEFLSGFAPDPATGNCFVSYLDVNERSAEAPELRHQRLGQRNVEQVKLAVLGTITEAGYHAVRYLNELEQLGSGAQPERLKVGLAGTAGQWSLRGYREEENRLVIPIRFGSGVSADLAIHPVEIGLVCSSFRYLGFDASRAEEGIQLKTGWVAAQASAVQRVYLVGLEDGSTAIWTLGYHLLFAGTALERLSHAIKTHYQSLKTLARAVARLIGESGQYDGHSQQPAEEPPVDDGSEKILVIRSNNFLIEASQRDDGREVLEVQLWGVGECLMPLSRPLHRALWNTAINTILC